MSLLSSIAGQKIGSHTGVASRHKEESRHSAVVLFNEAKQRLLDINNWGRLCGNEGTEFRLTDENGELLQNSTPVVGNLIRVKLPASATIAGNNYNWLKIEKFEHTKDLLKDEELFGFFVSPVKHPSTHAERNTDVRNYDETNSFLICRTGCLLTAVEYDVNKTSSANTISFFNKLKMQAIAVWAMTGLVKPQWKKLLNGIIKPTFTYA